MLQFSDIAFLLDLAKSAPLQRADMARTVDAVFVRVEQALAEGQVQQAVDAALAKAAKQVADTPPQSPASPAQESGQKAA